MTPIARRIAPALLATLACAACQPASRADSTPVPMPPSPTGDSPREQPADTVILGEATYRERIKMPPGASLQLELVRLDGAAQAVVASVRKPDVAGPPIPFSLPYEASRVDPAGRYGLRAALIGPDGERWMATAAPVPLVPGSGMSVEVLLQGSEASGNAPATPAPAGAQHWECGDLGVMSRVSGDASSLRLDANGRAWTLASVRSPSGARYADSTRNAFSILGATGSLALSGEPARECVRARQASPWNDALLRGVAFRAVGNEPGWFVEVDGGATAALRGTLDYGERTLSVARATRRGTGFAGSSGGEVVTLDIRDTPCTDAMSGQRFKATVTLMAGTRRYEGCGARLGD